MDDLHQNKILIKDSRDLHLKYAQRRYIKFKIHYILDSHQSNWKRLQLECEWKLMKKINNFILRFLRQPEFAPDYNHNFGRRKYIVFYAAKTYYIILHLSA
eukprot:523759_1